MGGILGNIGSGGKQSGQEGQPAPAINEVASSAINHPNPAVRRLLQEMFAPGTQSEEEPMPNYARKVKPTYGPSGMGGIGGAG